VESDSDVGELKPEKTALEDFCRSNVLLRGGDNLCLSTQSLISQINHELARYRKDIPIPLKFLLKNKVAALNF